jgi:hypothetical protein
MPRNARVLMPFYEDFLDGSFRADSFGTGGMNLNHLLAAEGIDPTHRKHVLVMRHRPAERALRKVLPWLAAFNTIFYPDEVPRS